MEGLNTCMRYIFILSSLIHLQRDFRDGLVVHEGRRSTERYACRYHDRGTAWAGLAPSCGVLHHRENQ